MIWVSHLKIIEYIRYILKIIVDFAIRKNRPSIIFSLQLSDLELHGYLKRFRYHLLGETKLKNIRILQYLLSHTSKTHV